MRTVEHHYEAEDSSARHPPNHIVQRLTKIHQNELSIKVEFVTDYHRQPLIIQRPNQSTYQYQRNENCINRLLSVKHYVHFIILPI